MAIVAFVEDDEDLRTLHARNRIEPVRHCVGVDEFVHRIRSDRPRVAVVDVDAWPAWATAMLEKGVADDRSVSPVWLRFDPTSATLDKLSRLSLLPFVVQALIRRREALEIWLDELSDRPRSATIPTLRHLAGPPAGSDRLFAAALVFAEWGASETEVAAALAMSARELRRCLSRAGFPAFPAMMGMLSALHAAWRLSELYWPTKRVAAAAGYTDVKPFEKYLRAHTGLTPRQVRDNDGYVLILGRVEHWRKNELRRRDPV